LETLGARNVKVLRGGLAAWQAAGGAVATGAAAAAQPGDFATQPDNHPIATADEIQSVLDARDGHIVDARSLDAFMGKTTDARPGHIPGAASLPAATLYRSPDEPVRPHELRLALSRVHVHTVHPIVIYGDSVAEAASVYFALRLLGVVRVDVYPGGYAAWSSDAANPVEKPAAGAAPVTVSTTCFQ
ncbi:MAG TPA: rhodanese-like domain-containing protein, partial [Limnochordia bacterium]|nr:rhodanese-like domain-containing protein [Limnochordia bacterium]